MDECENGSDGVGLPGEERVTTSHVDKSGDETEETEDEEGEGEGEPEGEECFFAGAGAAGAGPEIDA